MNQRGGVHLASMSRLHLPHDLCVELPQHKLVNTGAAPKDQLVAKQRVAGKLDNQTGEDEILLDCGRRRPGMINGPRLNSCRSVT